MLRLKSYHISRYPEKKPYLHSSVHKFYFTSRTATQSRSSQRLLMDTVGKTLNIVTQDGWYNVTRRMLQQNGAGSLLQKYSNSPSRLLSSVYPECEWDFSKFNNPQGYWDNSANQRCFLDELAKKLNITDQQGWYNITAHKLLRHGGGTLLAKFGNSPSKLVSSVYHEHNWDHTKFRRRTSIPHEHSISIAEQRHILDALAQQSTINEPQVWFKITASLLHRHGQSALLPRYDNSLSQLLASVYPEYKQACRELLMNTIQEWKLNGVLDALNVPIQYHIEFSYLFLVSKYVPDSTLLITLWIF